MGHSTDAKTATKMLPHLASFVTVMESGSFSAAARRLGIDKTLVSRRVKSLETALGVRLLQRTTRQMAATDAGRKLFEQVANPLGEAVNALLHASEPAQIEGTVQIATGAGLSAEIWVPIVERLRTLHPLVRLDIRALDTFVDLIGGGFDFALRTGNMPDSTLSARSLCAWPYILCATPTWIEKNSHRIQRPEDVADDWILYGGVPKANRWHFRREDETIELETGATVIVDTSEVLLSMLYAGLGVAALPAFGARLGLESGKLVRVLPQWSIEHGHRIWLVVPNREYIPARVRAVIEVVEARIDEVEPKWRALADAAHDAS